MALTDIHEPRILNWDLGTLEPILRSSSDLEVLQACGLIFVLTFFSCAIEVSITELI